MFEMDDAIVDVKRQVADAVYNWNNRYRCACVYGLAIHPSE